tara:strand:+ start:200 stop:1054 length:855 start_codon:yes stop_codon:yes gene_type:complete
MSNNNYNNIELTEDEIQSLENPDIELETTESPPDDKASDANTEETSLEEVTEPVDVDNFEIDGKDYSRDQILQWRDDSDNKDSWQKSNTEKAQGLSKWNKLAEKIQEDESFRSHLKDFYYDDPEAVKALGLDGNMEVPGQDETVETPSEIESRLDVLEEIEGERVMEHRVDQLDGALTKLENANPDYLGDQDKVSEFLEFADNNSQRFLENGMPNLESAFKEWSYDQMQEQLAHYKKLDENGKRNTGIINTSELGAKEIKSDKKATNWKDISMNNPDIAKYFDD